jgi:hypothetical protein
LAEHNPDCTTSSRNPSDSPARHPRSPAQIAASRANGSRSQGPVSSAGKAISRANALRHGLLARRLGPAHAASEWHEDFEAALSQLIADYKPRNQEEWVLVEFLAEAIVRAAAMAEVSVYLTTDAPATGQRPCMKFAPLPGPAGDLELRALDKVAYCFQTGNALALNEAELAGAHRILDDAYEAIREAYCADRATRSERELFDSIVSGGFGILNRETLAAILAKPNCAGLRGREVWLALTQYVLRECNATGRGGGPQRRARVLARIATHWPQLDLIQQYEQRQWREIERKFARLEQLKTNRRKRLAKRRRRRENIPHFVDVTPCEGQPDVPAAPVRVNGDNGFGNPPPSSCDQGG